MRAVVQRVDSAAVEVEGAMVGSVGKGLLVLLGVEKEDTDRDLEYLLDKVAGLRIFEDEQEKMNLSVADVGGGLLVVSQFTLYGVAARVNGRHLIRRRVLKWPMLIMKNLWPVHGRRGLASAPGSFRRICL